MKNLGKFLVAILLLSVAALSASAQNLTVRSMKPDASDLTACINERLDLNNRPCALVKVQIPLEGMQFEGSIIHPVEYKAGEYWVYMPSNTKMIKIKHPSFKPLFVRFTDYDGVGALQAKVTYVLDLDRPASSPVAQPAEEVTFRVTPADAILIVDDVEREVVGGVAKISLTHGSHKCSVSYPGYKATSDEFIVRPGVTKRIYELDPKSGSTPIIASTPTQTPAAPAVDFAAIKAEADKAYDNGYYNRALELYMKISDDKGIQNRIGYMYQYAQGVSQDYTEAVRWYRKAAEQGYAAAQCNLGWMYDTGKGVSQDYAEAVRWYRKAAEQGYASAQHNLGYMYANAQGVSQDYTEAVRWYRKAAEQGNARAQCNLGYMYEKGNGVGQDYTEAVRWYRKAAEQGNARAQNNLGYMYANARGVTKDYYESAKWYKKSADQDYSVGCSNWGWSLYYGHGVAQDRQEAYRWMKKAADAGSDWAKKFIAEHTF